MRKLLISAFVSNLAFLINNWASKWTHGLIVVSLAVPLFLLFVSAGRVMLTIPVKVAS
jgi:hypothetical protein